jgi:uncharacterized membrane protein
MTILHARSRHSLSTEELRRRTGQALAFRRLPDTAVLEIVRQARRRQHRTNVIVSALMLLAGLVALVGVSYVLGVVVGAW